MSLFDINGWEFMLLVVIAVVVLGPERLPEYAAKLRRLIKQVRAMADTAPGPAARADGPGVRRHRLAAVRPPAVRPATDRPRGAARGRRRRVGGPGEGPVRWQLLRPERGPRRSTPTPSTPTRPERRRPAGGRPSVARPAGVSPSERPARPRERVVEAAGDAAQRHGGGAGRAAPSTTGMPSSAPSRRRVSIGIWPSSGTGAPTARVSESATAWPPPEPKISWREPSGSSSQRHVLDDADDALVGLQGDRAGALGHLGGGLLRRGDDEDLGRRG